MTFEQHLHNVLDIRQALDTLYPEKKKKVTKDLSKDKKKKD